MSAATGQPGFSTAQFRTFAIAAAVLTLGFARPLWHLFWFAISDDLHSYIPLMPLVCAYLAWTLKSELPLQSSPARGLAMLFFAAGAAAVAGCCLLGHSSALPDVGTLLALATLGWILCLTGAGCWILGGPTMWALAFPFFLLVFMVPFPVFFRNGLEAALEHGSAVVAHWMFILSLTPVWRNGMVIRLPGFNMEVAPECSGIHSTWILFITSLVAGRMILRRPRNRLLLCLAVLPLALLRNGFRVFVIGQLCIHISPRMINSPIHHHGGPLFFVLSLVPFFLLLYYIRKSERTIPAQQLSNSEK